MAFRGFIKFLTVCGIVAASSATLAQTPDCNRYRSELAALDRNDTTSAATQRERTELARMQEYYRSIGCERRGFLFSSPPPDECPAIAQRMRNISASLDRMTSSNDAAARRQQLIQAINQNCSGGDNRNFFERLFGVQSNRPVADPNAPISEDPENPTLGGSRMVCVRLCDGYDFPLASAGKASPDEMCQALCPGAETRAFSMPNSDDGLLSAVAVSSRSPYSAVAGAFRFQKNVDPASCYCKGDQEKWADVLKRAEQLLDRHDTIVSPERAAEMSRAPAMRNKQAAIAKQTEAETAAAAKEGEAAPTAGRESAGIGPQSIESGRIVTRTEGIKIESRASDGSKRTIRVITPSTTSPVLTEEDGGAQ